MAHELFLNTPLADEVERFVKHVAEAGMVDYVPLTDKPEFDELEDTVSDLMVEALDETTRVNPFNPWEED